MTKAELLAAIRAKHPEYKGVPDDTLVNAALKSHPEYQKALEPEGPSAVEMMADAKNGGSTTPGMRGTPDQAWWDGFLQELGLEGPKSPLVSAAHPQTAGDFLTDIIPSEMAALPGTKAIPRAVSAFKQAGSETSGLKSALTLPVRAYNKFAEGVKVGVPEEGLPGFRVNRYQANKSGYVPGSSSDIAVGNMEPDITPHGPASTSGYKADSYGEAAEPFAGSSDIDQNWWPKGSGGAEPGKWTPDYGPMDYGTKEPLPTVAGKAPVLEDVLNDILRETMEPEGPSSVTLAEGADPVGAGATKQSGKFGKSGQLGQAGGYTSGLPPTTDTRYDELLHNFGGTQDETILGAEAAPASDVSSSLGAPDEWDAPVSDTELNPGGMAQQAQDLRDKVGSRDAARQMGVKRDELRTMAPGESKTPDDAARRIMAADMGMDDGMLKSMMLLLGGAGATDYYSEDAR